MRLTGLTPAEFTLLFSGAALLAVLFYLLSFRRRMAVVAADPLWRRVVGKRRTPFRKLLALLGQLLILFLLVLALGDPRISPEGMQPPVAVAAVVDTSASMGALEPEGTRLEQARRVIEAVAEEMGPRDRLMLMALNDGCRPQTPFTTDIERIRAALAELEPSAMPENPDRGLLFAASALGGAGLPADARRRILLISDRFHPLSAESIPENTELWQVAVGASSENLAVTALDVHRRGGAARGHEVFVEVTNYGLRDQRARLSIHTPASLLGEERIGVPAGQSVSRTYFLEPVEGERLMATLTAGRGSAAADGFSIDDRAFARIAMREDRKVVLVTENNLFLSKALALNPSISLVTVSPRRVGPRVLQGALAAVFDGVCPATDLPAAYFNPPPGSGCPFSVGDPVEFPALLPLRGDHPVTDGVTLVDVRIQRAHRLVPVAGDTELLSDAEGPLVIARRDNGRKLLGVGFDVAESDLPLRVAFPLMMHNILDWFIGEEAGPGLQGSSVGGLVEIPDWVDPSRGVTGPQGGLFMPRRIGGRWLFRPRSPGFYTAGTGPHRWLTPVNFHRIDESTIAGDRRPGPGRIHWNRATPQQRAALSEGFDPVEHAAPEAQWPTVLLAVAWLLLFDWIFFCFRILF